MALDQSTVSLNLAGTLNQAEDPKVAGQESLSVLQDFVRNKNKRLDKRPGMPPLATTSTSNWPNPLGIGATNIPCGVFSHKNQLLLQNRGSVYSYDANAQTWRETGRHYPVEAKSETLVSNEYFCLEPDMGRVGNISVTAYVQSALGLSNKQQVNYTVVDENTGNKIVFDRQASALGNCLMPRVLTFASAIYIVWQRSGNLEIAQVSLVDGSLSAVTVLEASLPVQVFNFDWTYSNQTGVGERVHLLYLSNVGGVPTGKILAVKNDGTVDSAITTTFTAPQGAGSFGVYYSATNAQLFVAVGYQVTLIVNPNVRHVQCVLNIFPFTFTASSVTALTNQGTVYATENDGVFGAPNSVTMCDDPTTPGGLLCFFDGMSQSYFSNRSSVPGYETYYLPCIYGLRFTATAAQSALVVSRGALISAKCVPDTSRKTVYLPCEYSSEFYGTALVLDVFQGKTEAAAYVLCSLNQGNNYSYSGLPVDPNTGIIYSPVYLRKGCASTVVSGGTFVFPSLVKAFVSTNQAQAATGTTQGSILSSSTYTTAVGKNTVNLIPKNCASREYLNGTTLMSGGYLASFDGATLSEHNFFLPPDYVEAFSVCGQLTGGTGAGNNIAIQAGTSTAPQITTIDFWGGSAITGGNYWTYTSTTKTYDVYYIVDGVGSDPAISGHTSIPVPISAMDSSYLVTSKTIRAMSYIPEITIQSGPNTTYQVNFPNQMQITNTANGSVTNAVNTNMRIAITSGPTGGTSGNPNKYQYSVVWNWVDANGQMHRSSTSIAITSLFTNSGPACVNVLAPPITNRPQSGSVGVEIYRTQANGTQFYRLTPFPLSLRWNAKSLTLSYLDTTPDTLLTGEQLYTTGGILPNSGIGACRSVSRFKNRILVSGQDEATVYYSKTAQPDNPVLFSNVMYLALEQDGQAINGHAQLDDKLVIFKDSRIIWFAGDGANDLGTNASFSEPENVPTDVGCTGQNTIATTPDGIWFNSQMGIQLLTRSGSVAYKGQLVQDFNQNKVSRAVTLKADAQVRQMRFTLSDVPTALVYDYLADDWATFSNYQATDACLWQGVFTKVSPNGVVSVESKTQFSDGTVSYSPIVRTQWLKVKDVQDFARVWRLSVLGEYKTPHTLSLNVFYDYNQTASDYYSISSTALADGLYQWMVHLKRQKCEAIMVQLTAVPSGGTEQSLTLTDISFIVGLKRGFNKLGSGKQS